MKIKKRIEIARSSTQLLSSMGQPSAYAACKMLRRTYTDVNITIINDLSDLKILAAKQPDLVFNTVNYVVKSKTDNSKTWVSSYLKNLGIECTGSTETAQKIENDKSLAKKSVVRAGLNTSTFFVAKKGMMILEKDMFLDYPVFIKPTNRGAGVGIDERSVAHTYAQMTSKINSITVKHAADSLVEEYLNGREFSVAILKESNTDAYLTMPLELIAPKNNNGYRILSSAVKSADTEKFIALTDNDLRRKICSLALDAFKAIGARDYGRIDIRLDKNGIPQFLEANLIPSLLNNYGNFPKACKLNEGIGYQDMLLRIVNLAFERTKSPIHVRTQLIPLFKQSLIPITSTN